MREFMHYITNAFYGVTGWNDDNTYKELNATARGRFRPPPLLPSCPGVTVVTHRLTERNQSSSTSPFPEDFA